LLTTAAKRIILRLTRADSVVSLPVSDDGLGFEQSRLSSGGGLLLMMQERASQLNGTFEYESARYEARRSGVVIPFR